jgi:hypothetical protein
MHTDFNRIHEAFEDMISSIVANVNAVVKQLILEN